MVISLVCRTFATMKKIIFEYLGIIVGCFITSVAFVFLINPYKLVPGGVYGTSIVLHNLFPSFQVGTFGYMISIPLLILSYFFLGKNIGARTLVASLVTPSLMNLLTTLAYPTEEAMHTLDPSLLAGGQMDLSNDLILACIIGPILIGLGEGIMMRCKATSGGSDIVAMLIHKYLRVRFTNALIAVDAAVICFGLIVIGFGLGTEAPTKNAWLLSGYSLICIVIMSKTVAYVISGEKNNKLIFIITDHDKWEVRDFILDKLDRTATVITSHGLYSQQDKATLMMVVRMREVDEVTTAIGHLDPNAFVIVTDAYNTFGLRWKSFPQRHQLNLE